MKKSYIAALIFIGVTLIAIIAYYFISTYGPGSENAQMKKRVEYILESYGAINSKDGTWSNYKPLETDLVGDTSAKGLASMVKRPRYDTEKETREGLLLGDTFKIEEVEKKDDYYVVTVTLKRVDGTNGTTYFIFEKIKGEWVLDPSCIDTAVYVGNGIGGSGDIIGDILDYVIAM